MRSDDYISASVRADEAQGVRVRLPTSGDADLVTAVVPSTLTHDGTFVELLLESGRTAAVRSDLQFALLDGHGGGA